MLTKKNPNRRLSGQLSSQLSIQDLKCDAEVAGAIEAIVTSPQDAMSCLKKGMIYCVTGATAMNAESSRSHAILTVIVEQKDYKQTADFADAAGGDVLGSCNTETT
eukprot:4169468-Ditylum_brightwellii.AAC.2